MLGPMEIDAVTGLIRGIPWIPSPNCDARPPGVVPDLVVVHGISLPPGEFGGPWIEALFTNRLDPAAHPYFAEIADARVSAHLLIRRDGSMIQFVPFHRRAWHAGLSCHEGRTACNDFSIGIELEGADEVPYEPVQYEGLATAVRALSALWPAIGHERLAGHADIAPGRKTDPGPAFDWGHLRRVLEG